MQRPVDFEWALGTVCHWETLVMLTDFLISSEKTKTNDLKVQFEIGHEIAVVPKKKKKTYTH